MNDLAVDDDAGRREDSESGDPRVVRNFLDVDLDTELRRSARTICSVASQRLQPGPSTLTSFTGFSFRSGKERVEQITDSDNAEPDHADETAISFVVSTLRKMIISGNDNAVTLIMKASTVPSATPLPRSAPTTGMMPAALE